MDPRQRQRLGWIARFFALLLVLTLLARGTAGVTMPTVIVQKPASGSVTKSVRTTGTVSLAGGTPFTEPTGLLVLSVPVRARPRSCCRSARPPRRIAAAAAS